MTEKESFFASFEKSPEDRPALRFAIPSFNRSNIVSDKTVSSLISCGVKPSDIFVFLSDWSEESNYRKSLPKDCHLVQGGAGITAQRRIINSFFDEGDRVVSLDDDITIVRKQDKVSVELDESFVSLSHRAFDFCDLLGLRMWGIQPLSNTNFSRHQSIGGLNMVMGILYGEYAGEKDCQPSVEGQCEDLEKSLLHYQTYGGTLKLCDLNRKSKPFAPGGCDTYFNGKKNRDLQCEEAYLYLLSKFPKLICRKIDEHGKEMTGSGSVKTIRSRFGSYPSLLTNTPFWHDCKVKQPEDPLLARERIEKEFSRKGLGLPSSWA